MRYLIPKIHIFAKRSWPQQPGNRCTSHWKTSRGFFSTQLTNLISKACLVKLKFPQSRPKQANCDAVAGLNIEWDFARRLGIAEFVEGPKLGMKRSLSCSHMTGDLLEQVQSESAVAGKKAKLPTQREGAKELVTRWCAAVLRDEEDVLRAHWIFEGV